MCPSCYGSLASPKKVMRPFNRALHVVAALITGSVLAAATQAPATPPVRSEPPEFSGPPKAPHRAPTAGERQFFASAKVKAASTTPPDPGALGSAIAELTDLIQREPRNHVFY